MANPSSSHYATAMEPLRVEYQRMKRCLEDTQEDGERGEADQLLVARGFGALRAVTAVARDEEDQQQQLDDEAETEGPPRKKQKTSAGTATKPSTSSSSSSQAANDSR